MPWHVGFILSLYRLLGAWAGAIAESSPLLQRGGHGGDAAADASEVCCDAVRV